MVILSLGVSLPSAAQEKQKDFCTTRLRPAKGENVPYGNHGNRCEGFYDKDHSAHPGLVPVSLIAASGTALGTVPGGGPVPITWTIGASDLAESELALQLNADPGLRHYQVNTRLRFGDGKYDWPTDLLQRGHLVPGDLYPTATLETQVADEPSQKVYVPIRFGDCKVPAKSYHFVLAATNDVNTVSYALDKVQDGKWVKALPRTAPERIFHRADSPFAIDVLKASLEKSGKFLRIRVNASLTASPKGEALATDPPPMSCTLVFVNE